MKHTTELAKLKSDIHQRFDRLTLSLQSAQRAMGIESEKIAFELTEQSDARRTLLRVEKQAIRDKELNKRSHASFVNSIRDMVHKEIRARLIELVKDPDNLFHDVLAFDHRLPEVLDLLSTKACSISKLEPSAANMPWLYDELIKLINTPKYRKVDAKGKVVVVESFKVALSFLGIENLRMLIPSVAFRRCLPQITDPYPEIKTRLMEASIGTAMSCKKIAQVSDLDEYHGFILGLLHDLGKIAVIRLYFKLFDAVHKEATIEAESERKRDEHLALGEITPSDEFLRQLIEEFSYPLSARFFEIMQFKRLFVSEALNEFAQNKAVSHMSPYGKLLAQGVAYNRYRTLKLNKMINMDEAKDFLRQFYFPKGALSVLKTTDLRELDVEMDEN
ncbi:HDOD domain-containing protein [Aliiglaciecola sp. M165]|uniref:HDOD domain-containing protein n=1 Tax=Aliiglaciecola sp. M165 TaxID=2593649 RepID=UPI00117CB8BA|nr:HDOD domain-containing protein [Aliiglaciecola sp. M165]TRY31394.1 HDOD domain-containing protein [Aliiglaciecola sp. M165]